MPIENIIIKLGMSIGIIINSKINTTTAAKIKDDNTIDFSPHENLRSGDIIKTVDARDTYTVLKVNPIKYGKGKISHIQVLVK